MAGLILVRELDERLATLIGHLSDSRKGLNTQFVGSPATVGLQPARGLDLNDSADPTFRLIGSPIWDRGAALTSTLHWFETEL